MTVLYLSHSEQVSVTGLRPMLPMPSVICHDRFSFINLHTPVMHNKSQFQALGPLTKKCRIDRKFGDCGHFVTVDISCGINSWQGTFCEGTFCLLDVSWRDVLKAGTFCLSDVSCKGRFVCDPTVYTNSDSIQKYTYFEVALKCVSDLQYCKYNTVFAKCWSWAGTINLPKH